VWLDSRDNFARSDGLRFDQGSVKIRIANCSTPAVASSPCSQSGNKSSASVIVMAIFVSPGRPARPKSGPIHRIIQVTTHCILASPRTEPRLPLPVRHDAEPFV